MNSRNHNDDSLNGHGFFEHDIPFGQPELQPDKATAVILKDRPKDETKGQRPHVVLVWNDQEHSELFVIGVLMEVCKMNLQQAIQTTMKIHAEGKAAVIGGLLEYCELKRDQIATFRDALVISMGGPNVPLNVTVAEA